MGPVLLQEENRGNRRKPVMLGRDKLDNTLLTCDQGNFNQIIPRSRNRTLITVVRDTCTTTVPPVVIFSQITDLNPFTMYFSILQNRCISFYNVLQHFAKLQNIR